MTIKRMLCASDFSPASRPALRLAQELARTLKAKLILFHAYEASVPISNGGICRRRYCSRCGRRPGNLPVGT